MEQRTDEDYRLFPAMKTISSVLIICFVIRYALSLYRSVWAEPRRLRRRLKLQGIVGPTPSFLYGNSLQMRRIQSETLKIHRHSDIIPHDYTSSLFPYLHLWRKQYGRVYTYSTGSRQHLYLNQPELVKEMNQNKTLNLGKASYVANRLRPILGKGVITSNGFRWAHQRKIIAPEFFMDKVKGTVGTMVESVLPMLEKWEEERRTRGGMPLGVDIKVDEDLRAVSADIISRACFGSSYAKGKEIFSKLRCLEKTLTQHGLLFNFNGFSDIVFRSKNRQKIRDLEREVETLIWETVKQREKERIENSSHEKDLMQSILEGAILNNDSSRSSKDDVVSYKAFVVDNCKSVYFAGHETTAVAASWCLMLLALNPEWQSRIREEVTTYCKNGIPDADSIPLLKTVTMVIQETLRLYPPASFVSREALEDTKLGNITVPKGVCIWTLIPTLHRDTDVWGPDANEFRPERFIDGVSGACSRQHPQAYVPFGLGMRLCLGKNFAMVELKIIISLIVSRFSFSLSPEYTHSPTVRMLVEPGHGVIIRLESLTS